MCATLVALGFFKEIYFSFLIVGHTHENIDQHLSSISSTLRREESYSFGELLQIIERPIHTEPFVHVKQMEHIRDRKKFITLSLISNTRIMRNSLF